MAFRSTITRLKESIYYLSYHQVLMIVLAIAIVLLSILLAGCSSSNSLSNVYLLSLEYTAKETSSSTAPGQVSSTIAHVIHNVSQIGNETTLEVRAGYMGICVTQSHTGRRCSSNIQMLASSIQSTETTPDPLNLIMIANQFKEKIVFDGLIYLVVAFIFICFLILSTFPGWHDEDDENGSVHQVKAFPSQMSMMICLLLMGTSFGFSLISALWQHINSSATITMTEILTYGAVSGRVGGLAMALGWLSTGLIAFTCTCLLVMIGSIGLIRRITDED